MDDEKLKTLLNYVSLCSIATERGRGRHCRMLVDTVKFVFYDNSVCLCLALLQFVT